MGTSMGTTKSFQIQSEEWERKMDKQQDDFSTIPGYLSDFPQIPEEFKCW